MPSKIKDFLADQSQAMADRAQQLRKGPGKVARNAALKSAERIKSLKDPVRALSRSGQKLVAISQGTAQSLIELQAEIVTNALGEAAAQLERAARTENVMDLVRDQGDVLRATRERIVADITQAVSIFKDAGGDVRKVAKQTYAHVAGKEVEKPAAAKRTRARKAKRAVRKTGTRARKTA
jgi:phasin family protein